MAKLMLGFVLVLGIVVSQGANGKRAAVGGWLLENGRFGRHQRGQHRHRPDKEQSR